MSFHFVVMSRSSHHFRRNFLCFWLNGKRNNGRIVDIPLSWKRHPIVRWIPIFVQQTEFIVFFIMWFLHVAERSIPIMLTICLSWRVAAQTKCVQSIPSVCCPLLYPTITVMHLSCFVPSDTIPICRIIHNPCRQLFFLGQLWNVLVFFYEKY